MNEEQQILIDNYKQLPADLDRMIRSVVQNDKLLAQFNLPKDQLEEVTEETLLVLLGIQHMSDYESNLKSVTGLDSDLASTIAGHVHIEVFRLVDKSLERVGGSHKDFAGETSQYTNKKEGGGGIDKESDVADSLGRSSALPHKKQSVLTWFVSRERQDVADQLREKLEKTERLLMLVKNFNGQANNQQPQVPNQ